MPLRQQTARCVWLLDKEVVMDDLVYRKLRRGPNAVSSDLGVYLEPSDSKIAKVGEHR